jgi:uncharacterized protein (TIGR02118 family)
MCLIAFCRQPADPQAFDQAYFEPHLPLIAKVPGLQKTGVSQCTGRPWGCLLRDGGNVLCRRGFLEAAMRSPQMGEAGANLATFADGLVAIMFAEESKPAG